MTTETAKNPAHLRETYPQQIEEILSRYPTRRSATMPLLWLAQRDHGYITQDAVREIARITRQSAAEVNAVVTFYTMFHDHPVGRHVIMVCESFSCAITGGQDLLAILKEKLGVEIKQTTQDGRFTLETESCLGACNLAPVMLIDRDLHHNLTPELLDKILSKYK